jgi:hypothetical protein
MRGGGMLLTYLHPGDLELKYWVVILLVLGFVMLLITVGFIAGLVAILKAINRRAEKKRAGR